MGMFDELHVDCPHCGEDVEFQSKAGDCQLHRYAVQDVPPEIAGDLNGAAEICDACGKEVTLTVQFMIAVN